MNAECYYCGDRATTTTEDEYGYVRPVCRACK